MAFERAIAIDDDHKAVSETINLETMCKCEYSAGFIQITPCVWNNCNKSLKIDLGLCHCLLAIGLSNDRIKWANRIHQICKKK